MSTFALRRKGPGGGGGGGEERILQGVIVQGAIVLWGNRPKGQLSVHLSPYAFSNISLKEGRRRGWVDSGMGEGL